MPSSPSEARLKIQGISKRFGSALVLDNINLQAHAGEVVAIVGENGSGKSTLVKILTGALQPDGGQMWLNEKAFTPKEPLHSLRQGISMVYQEDTLCPELSAAENILLGAESTEKKAAWSKFIWKSSLLARAQKALEKVSLASLPLNKLASDLSGGQKKSIMIARALLSNPSVLILDEPTNSLGITEQNKLADLIKKLKAENLCILYISHKPAEVIEIADRVIGLKAGRIVQELTRPQINESTILHLMMGLPIS